MSKIVTRDRPLPFGKRFFFSGPRTLRYPHAITYREAHRLTIKIDRALNLGLDHGFDLTLALDLAFDLKSRETLESPESHEPLESPESLVSLESLETTVEAKRFVNQTKHAPKHMESRGTGGGAA